MVASWHVDLSCCEDFVVDIMPVFRCNSTVMDSFFLLQEKVSGVRYFLFFIFCFTFFIQCLLSLFLMCCSVLLV